MSDRARSNPPAASELPPIPAPPDPPMEPGTDVPPADGPVRPAVELPLPEPVVAPAAGSDYEPVASKRPEVLHFVRATWEAIAGEPRTIPLLSALVHLPLVVLLLGGIALVAAIPGDGPGWATLESLFGPLRLLLVPCTAAVLAPGVLARLRGERLAGESWAEPARSRWQPVLGLAVLLSVVVTVGGSLFYIPGVFVACAMFVAAPVLIDEGRGVFGALARSWDLTEGYRGQIFGLLVVAAVAEGVLASRLANGGVGVAAARALESGQWQPMVGVVLRLVLAVATNTFLAVGTAVVSFQILRHRQGADSGAAAGR